MIKHTTVAVAAIIVSGASVFGAATSFLNINTDTLSYVSVADSQSALIPNGGGYAAIGRFSVEGAAIRALVTPELVMSQFTAFASTTFGGEDVLNADGVFAGSGAAGDAAIIPDEFNDQVVFYVVANGSDLASSTEVAVVQTSATFPDDDASNPTPITFDTSIASATADDVLVGSFITGINSAALDGDGGMAVGTIQLVGVAVPEPSTAILGVFSLFALALRRRR